ncbi:MAG TPA: phospho-sugar mutase [Gemmataceae bacterium]|nr:phospho-sugar mutase [Gemmataceae bacterium]
MSPFEQAAAAFRDLSFDDNIKEKALAYLKDWLTKPEFAPYRPQLEWLIQEKQWPGLLDRFYQVLPFGTGGRRGPVGIGPNRMNQWTLGASVQGHCEYLRERFPGVEPLQVVLTFDVRRFEDLGRNYNPSLPNPVLHQTSKDFVHYAAGVYIANGIHVHILPPDIKRFLATPELSFAIRELKAHGGLNISASHNPPDDNGGKFYDERGGQPVPPDDQIMSDLVDLVQNIKSLPWPDVMRSSKIRFLQDSTHRAYIDLCRRQSVAPPPKFDELKVIFTPLHGVGSMTAMEVLEQAGFRPIPVPEQMEPNGLFPNVTKSPNPEVPESLDRAIAVAKERQADLVLATDPDADRLGGAMADGRGSFRILTGNEIAVVLTHFKLQRLTAQGMMPASPIVITTEVTTRLVTRIARHFGAQVVNNLLVGFKHIAEVLGQLEQNGSYEDVSGTPADFVIGMEEAHGVLVTPQMRDKDAASACLLLAELALEQKRQRRTVVQYLDDIHRQFGYFHNDLRNIGMTGIEGRAKMMAMMQRLRSNPPKSIGGLAVTEVQDLQDENGRLGPFKGATDSASRNVLLFQLGENSRIALRPSGTEPKAKVYVEVCNHSAWRPASHQEWKDGCQEIDKWGKLLADKFVKLATSDV